MTPLISIICFKEGYASYEIRPEDQYFHARLLKYKGEHHWPQQVSIHKLEAAQRDRESFHPVTRRLIAALHHSNNLQEDITRF